LSAAEGLLHDLDELLDATEVATLEDLEEVIDGGLDYDCHLIGHAEGVEVRIHVTGILVAYPFMLTELWATARELEEEAEAHFAAEYAGEGLE
jgi:hypothetical protein